jgi:hypothetical protein
MTKWEYYVNEFFFPVGDDPTLIMQRSLDFAGVDGWELVHIRMDSRSYLVIFKRPLNA